MPQHETDIFLRSLEPALSDPSHPDHQQALACEAVYKDDHGPLYPPGDGWSGTHGDLRRRFEADNRAPTVGPGVTPGNGIRWRWVLMAIPAGYLVGVALARCAA
jgi:hypothetical protein